MLTLMVIFSMASIALFYASRIGEIQRDLRMLFGDAIVVSAKPSRQSHLIFLLFIYSAPLVLAAVLSTASAWMRRR